MSQLELIKESFEKWYNSNTPHRVSIVINYSDEQSILIKAYHKATIKMCAIGIKENLSYLLPLIVLSNNYNHGTTTEEEAKEQTTMLFLSAVLEYCSSKGVNS